MKLAIVASLVAACLNAASFAVSWDNTNAIKDVNLYLLSGRATNVFQVTGTNYFRFTGLTQDTYAVKAVAVVSNVESDPISLVVIVPSILVRLSLAQDTITNSLFSGPINGPFKLITNWTATIPTNQQALFFRAKLSAPPLP